MSGGDAFGRVMFSCVVFVATVQQMSKFRLCQCKWNESLNFNVKTSKFFAIGR